MLARIVGRGVAVAVPIRVGVGVELAVLGEFRHRNGHILEPAREVDEDPPVLADRDSCDLMVEAHHLLDLGRGCLGLGHRCTAICWAAAAGVAPPGAEAAQSMVVPRSVGINRIWEKRGMKVSGARQVRLNAKPRTPVPMIAPKPRAFGDAAMRSLRSVALLLQLVETAFAIASLGAAMPAGPWIHRIVDLAERQWAAAAEGRFAASAGAFGPASRWAWIG